MKSYLKNPVVIGALAVCIAAGLIVVAGIAVGQNETQSGISGVQGPSFTFGLISVLSTYSATPPAGVQGEVWNNAPWAMTGFALSKLNWGLHVWVSSMSKTLEDLGIKPGDIVTVFCAKGQVPKVNTGDWIQLTGITARGQLVRTSDVVMPAPFSY